MKNGTLAVIALVLAFVLPLAGLVLGIVALAQSGKSGGEGKGLAIAAIIINSVAMVLVLLVVIGGVAYFGLFSPSALLPEKCTFPVSMSCLDFAVGDSQIRLTLQNGAGRDMRITEIRASSDALTGGPCTTGAIPQTLRNGEKGTFNLGACTSAETGRDKNRYLINVTYSWLDKPSTTYELSGELLGRAR